MTSREKRKRQKRARCADVRKVHRYGFVPGVSNALRNKVDGPRNIYDAACGKVISDLRRRHLGMPYAVPDDEFTWLPRAVQCETCLAAPWPGNWPPRIQRSGVRTHRMALEMLFASMQRLWQARLEVGHRCYVSLVPRDMIDGGDGREAAGYTFCTCDGEPKWLDARTVYSPPRYADRPFKTDWEKAWEAYYGMPYEQLRMQP
jgi:hypothetical protein